MLSAAYADCPEDNYVDYSPLEVTKVQPRYLKISAKKYYHETRFEVNSDLGYLGNFVKASTVKVRKNYAFYNPSGLLRSKAYTSLFSRTAAMTDVDIYDEEENLIGRIESTFFTFAPAQFYFYDKQDNAIAIAEMDTNRSAFTLYGPENVRRIIATFNWENDQMGKDHWSIEIVDPNAIDLRMLISFGAFVVDYQDDFLKQRKRR
jgi:hypothetical protein